jgi:glyoxylase-like metal-dependent hydrolase (beta-lactamase superfamily II)
MRRHLLCASVCLGILIVAGWLSRANQAKSGWTEIAPGVLRSPGPIAGYALLSGDKALLIDAPGSTSGLAKHGVRRIEHVMLTHYHRAVCSGLSEVPKGTTIQAHKKAEEWLSPKGVAKYWRESLPLRGSRTAYQVVPVGVEGVDYVLENGASITWQDWKIEVLDAPGHALAHVFINVRKGDGPLHVGRQDVGPLHDRLGPLDRRRTQTHGQVAQDSPRPATGYSLPSARPRAH